MITEVALQALALVCAPHIHPTTLTAVVKVESAMDPLVLGVNGPSGGARRFQNIDQAVAAAEKLEAEGASYDLGLGQINNANRRRLGLTVRQLFDPCTNLKVADLILSDCYSRAVTALGVDGQPALHRALACYNAGPLRFQVAFDRGYVAKYVPALRSGQPSLQAAMPAPRPPAPATRAAPIPPAWGALQDRGWADVAQVGSGR